MIFKRKIYNRLLEWKNESKGNNALLIEGARRVGKSTIVSEFAKNEYKSFIIINFAEASQDVIELFNDISDLDYIFLQLQLKYRVDLYPRESLIVFDEVQLCPNFENIIIAYEPIWAIGTGKIPSNNEYVVKKGDTYYMYAAEISAENIHIIEQKLTNYM
mgnify:CR=1 FL=1